MNTRQNKDIETVNFTDVLNYKKPVARCYRSDTPFNECLGFCHDCEDKGLVPNTLGKVVRMSHGCTSSDYYSIIGSPLPMEKCAFPIMFLLENPGGDYDLGEDSVCDGITKQPPTKHFYFSSGMGKWPKRIDEIGDNHYGDYFAYLMVKHGLPNVYITNCVKCKFDGESYWGTAKNCMARFLKREIEIFHPTLIVCFSQKVCNNLLYKHIECPNAGYNAEKVCLIHPSADSRPKWRGNWTGIVKENDRRLEKALRNVAANELLRVDVVNELCTLSGEQWAVDGRCSIDSYCENSGVRYFPQKVAKQLPDGVGLYCVFNRTSFRGCEIAAWQKDAKREIRFNASSQEEKLEWHVSRCGNWIAWRGIFGNSMNENCKDEYGMTWDAEFFERIQGEPGYKKQIVAKIVDSIMKLYESLTT